MLLWYSQKYVYVLGAVKLNPLPLETSPAPGIPPVGPRSCCTNGRQS